MRALTGNRIKLKILWPSILIFLVGLIVVVIGTYYIQNKHLEQNVTSAIANVDRLYKANIEYDIQTMEAALLYIINDKEIQKAWQQKDRERLYSLCYTNFESLQHNQRITHLYFIDLNKKVFLRVHNPKKHGDILTRYTISEALRTKKRSVGVEFGIHHNFTLRDVHPWFIDGELSGFVEMGEEIDHILPHVANMLGTEVFVAFNKSLFAREKWEKGIRLYGHDTRWDILEKSVIIGKTMDYIPSGLDEYLNQQNETGSELFKHKEQNKDYIGGYIDLKDVRNEKVGKLVVLKDVTLQRETVKDYIVLVLIAGIVLFLLIMTIVVTYVNVISSRLDYYHRKLQDAAYIDTLTGIGNRRYLLEKTKMFFANEQTGVTMLIDIDQFKKINDNYGHDVGDDVLRRISKKMSEYVRQDDIFARFGGEEFIIILPNCALNIALTKAEMIRQAIEAMEISPHNSSLRVSVSMGIYQIKKGDSFEDVVKRADVALYQAKKNGRNRIEVYAKAPAT